MESSIKECHKVLAVARAQVVRTVPFVSLIGDWLCLIQHQLFHSTSCRELPLVGRDELTTLKRIIVPTLLSQSPKQIVLKLTKKMVK